jgi:hypothetical protein
MHKQLPESLQKELPAGLAEKAAVEVTEQLETVSKEVVEQATTAATGTIDKGTTILCVTHR